MKWINFTIFFLYIFHFLKVNFKFLRKMFMSFYFAWTFSKFTGPLCIIVWLYYFFLKTAWVFSIVFVKFIHIFYQSRRKSALPKYDPPYTKRQMMKGYSHPNSPHPSQHLTPDHTFDDAAKLGQGLGGYPPYRPVEYVLFCLSFAVLSVAILSVAVFSIAILSGHLVMWSI